MSKDIQIHIRIDIIFFFSEICRFSQIIAAYKIYFHHCVRAKARMCACGTATVCVAATVGCDRVPDSHFIYFGFSNLYGRAD